MTTVAALLLAAALGLGLGHLTRLPSVPLVILFGVAVSAIIPMPGDLLEDALMLGVTVVVFVAGIELNPVRVGRYRNAAVVVGLLQFFLLGAAGLGTALLLGLSLQTAAYVGLALSASSTLVVVRLLQQRRELYSAMGRTLTGILLLQDLLIILLIPVVIGMADGWGEVARGVGGTLALVALAGVLLRWVTPRLLPKVAGDEEFLLLLVLSGLFGFLGLAYFLGIPLVAGAFLAGVAVSPFPSNALVRGQLNSIGTFFSAIFFAALGAVVVLPSGEEVIQALFFAGLVLLLTPPLVAVVAERFGFSARGGIGSGLLLGQTSEFSLVVGLQGVILGQIDEGIFGVIVLVTVITMTLTPFLATGRVTGLLLRIHPFRVPSRLPERPSDHILLMGCGSSGVALLETLVGVPHPIWVVDDDPAIVERVAAAGFTAIRGDATDPEILQAAGANRARVVVSTMRTKEDSERLLAYTGETPVVVRAYGTADVKWIEERGGIPVSYSEAASQDFLDWFLRGEADPESGPWMPPER
ncbi:MAG: potassium transporter [Gemmatimonadales bacterium]|nr:MAG: potassium transporter [Gemmatimonadales bacterium]